MLFPILFFGALAVLGLLLFREVTRPTPKRSALAPTPGATFTIAGTPFCDFDIVGESIYQQALRKIERRRGPVPIHCLADIVCESDNPHDPNAVAVLIDGLKVGHFSRAHAAEYREAIARLGETDGNIVGCPAYINGTEFLGVKLGLRWPIRTAESQALIDAALAEHGLRYDDLEKRPIRPRTIAGRREAASGRALCELSSEEDVRAALEGKDAARISILFTGFAVDQRSMMEQLAQGAGLTVRAGLAKRLTLLCVGPKAAPAKTAAAREQNTAIIDAERFARLIQEGW